MVAVFRRTRLELYQLRNVTSRRLEAAALGDGDQQRSQPASTSGGRAGSLGVGTPLRAQFRLCVHDNVTQRLRLRVLVKARGGGRGICCPGGWSAGVRWDGRDCPGGPRRTH